jgi:hypothetical protein
VCGLQGVSKAIAFCSGACGSRRVPDGARRSCVCVPQVAMWEGAVNTFKPYGFNPVGLPWNSDADAIAMIDKARPT